MSNCKNCERGGKKNRLVDLPLEVVQSKIFRKKEVPVFLCPICDEYSLEAALKAHEEWLSD